VSGWAVTAPSTSYTSNGVAITWASSISGGVQTLVGTAGSATIGTLTMNQSTGAYSFTLSGPMDHAVAGTEDVLGLSFGVTAAAGGKTSAISTLTINVEDDAPAVIAPQVSNLAMVDTNLEIVLDVSGSMITTDGVGGQTRLASAIQSINTLLDRYDEFGDVRVKLVTFSTNAQSVGTTWTTVAGAKAQLAGLAAAGGTNYDEALGDAITAFGETGKLVGAQNLAYFFTDGLPTFGSGSTSQLAATSPGTPAANGTGYDQTGADTGIQTAEEALWTSFLNNNQVKSFAIAFGSGVTNTSYINPIAYDGGASVNTNGTLVSSFDQLDNVLAGTIQKPVGGQLVSGGLIKAGGSVGADGGFVHHVTVEGTTYTYDPAGAGSLAVTGTNHGTFDTSTNAVTITTNAGGQFVIDMDDGSYTYKAPASITTSVVETVNYTVSDRDGDTQASTITVNVDRTNVVVGTTGIDTMNGTDRPDLLMGRAGDDTLNGGAGNDTLLGGDGNDAVNGGLGNDTLSGGSGADTLDGGDGADTLIGGVGADILTGGLGADVFKWELADNGAAGAPTTDHISDFSAANPSAGGDVLDLRDLLQGDLHGANNAAGNLGNFLDFNVSGGSTTIRISTSGGFAGGTYAAGAEDQRIVLDGVDIRSALGLVGTAGDDQIIQELLTRGKLITD
jgi:T1SS-143 domain-containing protein